MAVEPGLIPAGRDEGVALRTAVKRDRHSEEIARLLDLGGEQ